MGCFKRGRYSWLTKTGRKVDGLSVYRLEVAALTPAVVQELAKWVWLPAGEEGARAGEEGVHCLAQVADNCCAVWIGMHAPPMRFFLPCCALAWHLMC